MDTPSLERLNKFLALQLGISRREADALIEKESVKINDSTATLGARFLPNDTITVDGILLTTATAHQYLLFHKPIGYVCSRRQQGDTPTIYSLLPETLHHLKPVGRLDKDTSGLLLLTNDGDFSHQMTHPSYHKQKTYLVTLDHDLQPLHQQMISDFGVMLEDGKSQFVIEKGGAHPSALPRSEFEASAPLPKARLTPRADAGEAIGISSEETARQGAGAPVRAWSEAVSDDDDTNRPIIYRITMHEGRNRQIRRTFAALGYAVTTLHRMGFGPYSLGDITPGKWQAIDIS